MATAREWCFDGLVGPSHGFGALAPGNRASQASRARPSSPRRAALQGLAKMRLVAGLGVPQAFVPPPPRPHWSFLRRLGLSGERPDLLARAAAEGTLLATAYSAASMWTANAATISPGPDGGGRVQVTPANLGQMAHRALEADTTAVLLRALLPEGPHFAHHTPLPVSGQLGDEGAANHSRLCSSYGEPGVQLFCHGRRAMPPEGPAPRRHPARQSAEACEALARLHGVPAERLAIAQVHPDAIDAGVFHADVIAVANRQVLLLHERAFVDQAAVLEGLRARCREAGIGLVVVEVAEADLSLDDAVATYLFNSQLVSLGDEADAPMALVAPDAVRRHAGCAAVVDRILADPGNPIAELHPVDLDESLRNGGGPACLRLRVVLDDAQAAAVPAAVRWSEERGRFLEDWVERHYLEALTLDRLADPGFAESVERALEELYRALDLEPTWHALRRITAADGSSPTRPGGGT